MFIFLIYLFVFLVHSVLFESTLTIHILLGIYLPPYFQIYSYEEDRDEKLAKHWSLEGVNRQDEKEHQYGIQKRNRQKIAKKILLV